MAQLPRKEAEFIDLADTAFRGFIDHPGEFPDPPVNQAVYAPKMNQYYVQKNAVKNAEQALKDAVAAKQTLLEDLRTMHRELKGKGFRFKGEPIEIPAGPNKGNWMVYLLDPDDFTLELIQIGAGSGEK